MTTFAVTGVTGPFGRTVVEQLLVRGVAPADVVAIARTPEKAQDLAARGVQVREGDYDRPETLDTALAGVDRLLLVSGSEIGNRVPQHGNVVTAAARAGVGRIGYTSILRADDTPLVLAPEHAATEQLIAESGIPATVLRNPWYSENYTGQVDQYVATGVVLHAAGEGRIAAATRAELAEAAAVALLQEVDGDVVHELAGPAFTYTELAEAVTDATGTAVVAKNVTAKELAQALADAGLDAGTVDFLVAVDQNIADGALDGDTTDLDRLLGRPATPITDAIKANVPAARAV
ncbi:NAD(P)H-binding protein [Georgenia sp.]